MWRGRVTPAVEVLVHKVRRCPRARLHDRPSSVTGHSEVHQEERSGSQFVCMIDRYSCCEPLGFLVQVDISS